jgi:hypothetical protein
MTGPETPPVDPAVVKKATSYYVYSVDRESGVLTPISDPHTAVPAANDLAAVQKTVEPDRVGSFAAIPVRNVNYRTREIETVPKEKWS